MMGILIYTLIIAGLPILGVIQVALCVTSSFDESDAARRGHLKSLVWISVLAGICLAWLGLQDWRWPIDPHDMAPRGLYFLLLAINVLQAIGIFRWKATFPAFVCLLDIVMLVACGLAGLSDHLLYFYLLFNMTFAPLQWLKRRVDRFRAETVSAALKAAEWPADALDQPRAG